MFDSQFDSLYDGSKICISAYAAVKSWQTALEKLFIPEKYWNVVAKNRKIDCSVDSDNHL